MTIETAKRKLQRLVNKMYTKKEQKNLSFLPDKETEKNITWYFQDQTQKIELICSLRTGIITRCSQGR